MSAKLERCPFCDGPAAITRKGAAWRAACVLCWIGVDSYTGEGAAAEMWNRRPLLTLSRLRAMLDAYNSDPAHQRMQLVPALSEAELLDEIPPAAPLEVSDG